MKNKRITYYVNFAFGILILLPLLMLVFEYFRNGFDISTFNPSSMIRFFHGFYISFFSWYVTAMSDIFNLSESSLGMILIFYSSWIFFVILIRLFVMVLVWLISIFDRVIDKFERS